MTKSRNLPNNAVVSLNGLIAVEEILEQYLQDHGILANRDEIKEVIAAITALTSEVDAIVLREEPSEIICNRCGNKTDNQASPDGNRCPDCYDLAQDVTHPDHEPKATPFVNQHWERGSDGRIWTEGKTQYLGSFHYFDHAERLVQLHNDSLDRQVKVQPEETHPELEIEKLLVAGTWNITEATSRWLDIAPADVVAYVRPQDIGGGPNHIHHGWIIHVFEEEDHSLPHDLWALLSFARAHGCHKVHIDPDGPKIPGLTHFDW